MSQDLNLVYAYALIFSGLILALWGGYSALDLTIRGENKVGVVKDVKTVKRPHRSGITDIVYEHDLSVDDQRYKIILSKSKKIGEQVKFRIVEDNHSNYSVSEDRRFPFNIFAGGILLLFVGCVYAKYLSTKK